MPTGPLQALMQHMPGQGRTRQAAQDIKADDIARPLPDGIQRRLAIKHGHGRFFDIAHAAQTLHRLVNHAGRAFVGQVFRQGHSDAGKGAIFGCGAVKGTGTAKAQRRCRLEIQRKIGQNRAHQWLVDQAALKAAPPLGPP